jgi:hypothetical protein
MTATIAHPSPPTPDELARDMRRRVAEIKKAVTANAELGGRDGLLTYVLYYWDDLPIDSQAWTAAGELLAGCAPARAYLNEEEHRRMRHLNPAAGQIAELTSAAMDASFDIDGAYDRMQEALAELQRVMRVLAPMEGDDDA